VPGRVRGPGPPLVGPDQSGAQAGQLCLESSSICKAQTFARSHPGPVRGPRPPLVRPDQSGAWAGLASSRSSGLCKPQTFAQTQPGPVRAARTGRLRSDESGLRYFCSFPLLLLLLSFVFFRPTLLGTLQQKYGALLDVYYHDI
jgi:hypothetical protein